MGSGKEASCRRACVVIMCGCGGSRIRVCLDWMWVGFAGRAVYLIFYENIFLLYSFSKPFLKIFRKEIYEKIFTTNFL